MKIGIFDSGRGGLSVVQKLLGKGHQIYYFADLKYAPYGQMDNQSINNRSKKIIKFLTMLGCQKIIVACNSASIALTDEAVIKISEKNIAVFKDVPNKVVLATKFSIASLYYQRYFGSGIYLPCSKLIAAIEAEDQMAIANEIREIKKMIPPQSNILLGCTHFALIKEQLAAIMQLPLFEGSDLLTIPPVAEQETYCFFQSGADVKFKQFIKRYLKINNFSYFCHYLDD